MFDRNALQMLVTKLDTNAVTLKYAKEWIKRTYGLTFEARTREQLIRKCSQYLKASGL